TIRGDGCAGARAEEAEERVGNGGDAVVEAVGDVERAGGGVKGHAGGADDERGRIGALGEAGADDGAFKDEGAWADVREERADDGAAVDGVAAGGDGAVEHVGDEESDERAVVNGGHVPWAVDVVAGDGVDDLAAVVENDEAAGAADGSVVSGGKAADDDQAATQSDEGGGEADAAGAEDAVWIDLGELTEVARGRDLNDGCAGALDVRGVVEVTDEEVASDEVTFGDGDLRDPVGVDVTVGGNGGTERGDGVEWPDERAGCTREGRSGEREQRQQSKPTGPEYERMLHLHPPVGRACADGRSLRDTPQEGVELSLECLDFVNAWGEPV